MAAVVGEEEGAGESPDSKGLLLQFNTAEKQQSKRSDLSGVIRELEGRAEALAGTFRAQEVASTLWAACVFRFFAPLTQKFDGLIRWCSDCFPGHSDVRFCRS